MSSQSSAYRTASQPTVNASLERADNYAKRSTAVSLEDEAQPEQTKVSVWWIPALMIGAWVELAYVVPAVAHWFAQLN